MPWVQPPITWAATSTSTYPVTLTLSSNSATIGIAELSGGTWYYSPATDRVITYVDDQGRVREDRGIVQERWGVRPVDHNRVDRFDWADDTPVFRGNDDMRRWAADRRLAHEEQLRARTAAVDRATATLLGLLNEAQRVSYEADRTFMLVGSHGGLYRIRPGSMGNVDWFDPTEAERPAGQLCAHPVLHDGEGHLPDPDVALAQLLHLTTDEPGWLRRANVHAGRAPRYPVAA
jgi:hypothetical protein